METPLEKRELAEGESPFDDWDRDHLVRFAQRCYAALRSLNGALALTSAGEQTGPFWEPGGTGSEALALCEAITREVGYDVDLGSAESENLYRAFYRTYRPLLFPDARKPDWSPLFPIRYTCDACRCWFEPMPANRSLEEGDNKWHGEPDCPGSWRVMTSSDLPLIREPNRRGK